MPCPEDPPLGAMADLSHSIDPESLFAQVDWLRALARSIVRDADAAEDVVQDTLVAALERDAPRRSWASRGAWLAAVAANFARRRLRANDARRFHEGRVAADRTDRVAPDDGLELVRLQQLLSERVLALREPYRSAIVLRFQQGRSYGAIARHLEVTTATARKRVSRGLLLLREDMERREGLAGVGLLWAFGKGRTGALAPALTLGGMTMSAKGLWIAAAGTALLALGLVGPWRRGASTEPAVSPEPVVGPVALVSPGTNARVAADAGDPGDPGDPGDDGAGVAAREVVPAPSEPQVQQALAPELLIRGRVVDGDGGAVAGARVVLRRDPLQAFELLDLQTDRQPRPVAERSSGPDGRFSFEVLRGVPYDLFAAEAAKGRSVVQTAYAGEELELRLAPGASFVGRVVDEDRRPVEDALVEAIRLPARTRAFSGRTDANGAFAFHDLEEGKLQVKIVPRRQSMLWGQQLTLQAGRTREHVFVVEDGPTIVGRIVDEATGQPIEGAVVGQGHTYEKVATSDAQGRYALSGFANLGVYTVYAHAPGYAEASVTLPTPFEERMTADFSLKAAVGAHGRIVDVDGRPIEGAYVAAAQAATGWRSAHTDGNGSFRLAGLTPDRAHCLFVVAKGYGTCAFEFPRPLRARGDYALGDVILEHGALVSGRIVDLSGRPLAGVDIHLTGRFDARFRMSGVLSETTADTYVAEREGRTDAAGGFVFADLAPGTYTIGAGPSGQTFARSRELAVSAAAQLEGLEIVLDAGWDIEGQVVDEAGDPVAGIVITLFPEPPTEGRMAQMFTGEDGRFSDSGFALGTYRMEVASTQLRPDHDTRPLAPQSLRGVDPFGSPLRIVLQAE